MTRWPIALLMFTFLGIGCQQDQNDSRRMRRSDESSTPVPSSDVQSDAAARQSQPTDNDGDAVRKVPPTVTTKTAGATAAPVNMHGPATAPMKQSAQAIVKPSKAAASMPENKNVQGTVTFTTMDDGMVMVRATITGFAPNSKHGFHIHEKGDLNSPDLKSTGDHFNPSQHKHGGPGDTTHAGDFGNLQADAQGNAKLELIAPGISIGTGKPNDILGKAVIVHAGADDLVTQPSGNSGARVAGGLIVPK